MTSGPIPPFGCLASPLRLSFSVIVAIGLPLLSLPIPAAANPDVEDEVQTTLEAEQQGRAVSRDKQLAKVIDSEPAYAPARWAAGFVKQEGKWLKFDAATGIDGDDEKLADYRQMRNGASDTAAEQLKLANWCHQHGLTDQERAHLLRVLDLEPNAADLRQRLGLKRVGGVWMLPQEARQAAARGKQAAIDVKHWRPKLTRLRDALNGPPGRLRDLKLQQVRAIREPSAVVSLETMLAPINDDAGAAVVDALAAMKRPEAAIALARLATFSESSDTADAARAKLKTLPRDHFVPAMLASLVIARTQESKLMYHRYGRLVFEQTFFYEAFDHKVEAVFDNVYQSWGWGGFGPAGSRARLAASTVNSARAAQRTLAIDAMNRQIERTSGRIMETLGEVTGEKLPADPKAWWKWWNDLNETVIGGAKPTQISYYEEDALLANNIGGRLHFHSCLVAGTQVWTERGSQAIEQIRVGDRVLAQNPASGELAYKLVLHTTVRPLAPLVHISFTGETIIASGGHPFWVSGRGWTNARQLQPEMSIHTVTGSAPIEKVEIDENAHEPVYNLVVEDFHDYFAGAAHLLLHDTTPQEPALVPVPGWKE